MSALGHRLRQLRLQAEMTQGELGRILGLSRSAISMYEIGHREPEFEILERYADYFNVDMNYMTSKTDDDYYYNLTSQEIAQKIMDNPELYALFDASRKASPKDFQK